jgi:iron(III) transport system substrate-binding protein
MKRLFSLLALASALAVTAAACSPDSTPADRRPAAQDGQASAGDRPGDVLTVYSRDREIAKPLFEQFEQQTGIKIRARWGNPVDLADQILADGDDSPADVFYGPLSDALGALSDAGRLAPLADEQMERVPEAYRAADGSWAGVSGRANAVFYNTDELSEADLPDSIEGFADPAWRGRIAWDPNARSLQAAVAALSQLEGEAAAKAWLEGMKANQTAVLKGVPFGAQPIIDAVAGGEIAQVGFGSHFYLYDLQADGDAKNVAAKFYPGDPAGLLSVDGVGIIKGTDNQAEASAFVGFMLSQTAEQYFAAGNVEIPVVQSVTPRESTLTATDLAVPGLDMQRLQELDASRDLLKEAGIIL